MMDNSEEIRARILNHREKKEARGLRVPNAETNYFHGWLKQHQKGLELPNMPRVLTHSPTHKTILVGPEFRLDELPEERRGQAEEVGVELELDHRQFSNQEILNWFVREAGIEGEVPYPNSF